MNKCIKTIKRKTVTVAFFIPFVMILLMAFQGNTIKEAFHNSIQSMFSFPVGLISWLLVIIFNIVILHYLRPVFMFWNKYNNNFSITMEEKNRAMYTFNTIGKKITIINSIAFVIGTVASSIEWKSFYSEIIPTTFILFEGLTVGLLASVLINMSLDNILYPIKSALMIDPPEIEPRYRSFYKQLTTSVILLLAFLGFQIFGVATEFYLLAADRASEAGSEQIGQFMKSNPEFLMTKLGRSHEATKELLDVFGLKIFLYFLISLRLLVLIKKTIKNPLDTVEERLELLTSSSNVETRKIEIVENNEFSIIYADINKLIEKQSKELKVSEDRLLSVIENAADPIISFDENGAIFMFNPAAENLFGWSKEEAMSRSFSSLFDQREEFCILCKDDNKKFVETITNADNNLQRYTGITRQGESITFEANFSKTVTHEGEIFTVIIRDISSQMEFEESLKHAKIAAERANQLKSEFLANMSHELRTPLNAVLGFTQLISSDKNLTESQVEKLNIISHSGEHLLGLINDILDISKIEAGKIELHESNFDLRVFVEDLKQMLDLKCKTKGLALYVEYVEPLPKFIKVDLGKLRQIMINILGNAIKFTSEGGIAIVVGKDGTKLKFSINDTGKGIPENEIETILQPFMQSSITDNEGGTGLGLAITNSFINMMGGSLKVESKLGVGSTFSFDIDYIEVHEIDDIEDETGNVLGIEDDRHPTVIVVDDKINNRLILKEMLERVGFVVIEAENGKEAVERIEEFNPELVFMDIKMPVMDGYEAVKKIKINEKIKNIPIFALTASAFKHDEKSILNSGFDGFLAKPFKQTSLFKLIKDKGQIKFVYEEKRKKLKSITIESLNYDIICKHINEDFVTKLDDLALINDFTGIKSFIDGYRDNSELLDFIDAIIHYTNNFDDENLLKIIEKIKESM